MFQSKREHRYCKMYIHANREDVFPMLCPERELEYMSGWTYRWVYSNSGLMEKDCVFVTPQYGTETTWILMDHDPENCSFQAVQFAKDLMAIQLRVRLNQIAKGETEIVAHYCLTALTETGNQAISMMSQERFDADLVTMQAELNDYFEKNAIIRVAEV